MSSTRGLSLVGLLVSLVCMVVLLSLTLPALRTATTGQTATGRQAPNSAFGGVDMMYLQALGQVMNSHVDGAWPKPSQATGSRDMSEDTTANLYSYLIMQNMTSPKQLVSKGDRGNVEIDTDYRSTLYDPSNRVYWDPSFAADLHDVSNVSYAHMPLTGDRLDKYWRFSMSSAFPLFGNRGPQDGIETADSATCHNGFWSGRVIFGDGHIEFLETPASFSSRSSRGVDGLFRIDDPQRGSDAILGFSEAIDEDGVNLQWD